MNVKRPAILFLTAFIFGIIIAYEPMPSLFKIALMGIAIFLYLKLFFDKKVGYRVLMIIVVFSLLGFFRFKIEKNIFDSYEKRVEELGKGTKTITGRVRSLGKSTNSNYLIVDNCNADGTKLGRARMYYDDEIKYKLDVKIGNYIRVEAGTLVIDGPSNEGEFNQKNYYRSNDISFISFIKDIDVVNSKVDILRQKIYEIKNVIKSQIAKILGTRDAGLFTAMLTGDRSTIDKSQKKAFSENGIAHIIAISGLHLSILGLAIFEFLRHFLSVNTSAGIVSIFIFLYGIFIDASAASLRAISMLYIRFLSLAVGRTYDSKNTLYIVAFVFLLMHPYLLFNAGFQFSYLAIFALNTEVIVNEEKKTKVPAVIVLTIFLFPVTIYHYFTYPLYSILLNLIVIPLMPFVLFFGLFSLISSFIYLPLAIVIGKVVHIIFFVYDNLCIWVGKLPYNILWLGRPTLYEVLYYYVAVFLIIYAINNMYKVPNKLYLKKIKRIIDSGLNHDEKYDIAIRNAFKYRILNIVRVVLCVALLVLTLVSISIRLKNDLRLTFISIGQGDGILVEAKDIILTIDGGSSSNTSNGEYILTPHIKSRSINHIDYAFITHADSDHTNGIMYLIENEDELKVKNLVLPINAENDSKFDKLKRIASESEVRTLYMKETDTIKFTDDLSIKVLSPDVASLQDKKLDQNELSLVFRLDYKNHSCLFTGDIGNRTMSRMVTDEYDKLNMDVEVLKVPHHGSKNSNVKEFFSLVSPKYAVVSYGKNNNYGHPNADVIKNIEDAGAVVLKTGLSGQVDIYFDKDDIIYRTYR